MFEREQRVTASVQP
ncbi:hypothetical protein LEMLEM_LOCUS21062 [Lemmus lemmus]